MIALFGNVAPLDGDTSYERITTVEFPELHSVEDAVRDVIDPQGVWVAQSAAPPSWVASDSPELEAALAAHFDCPTRPLPETL